MPSSPTSRTPVVPAPLRDQKERPRHRSYRRTRQGNTRQYSSSAPISSDGVNGINGSANDGNNDSAAPVSLFWPSNKPRRVPVEDAIEDADFEYHECDYYDEVFDSIVKIYATHNFEPDTTMPWQKLKSYNSYSSGFVIEGRRILTNAHSVEYAGQVLVRRRGSSQKYRATTQTVANECDLAVLTIDDDSFWTTRTDYDEDGDEDEEEDCEENDNDDDEPENGNADNDNTDSPLNTNAEDVDCAIVEDAILPLEFGVLPELQDEVEVLGYPTGGDSLSVTKGVVSRIEATEYAQCSGSHLLAIQIDAAINGGNSGGPVVDATTGKVVGVAFQALEHAENIGYVVPITVVQHFLEDIKRHGTYSGVTCLGLRYSRLENESMRAFLKLPKEKKRRNNNNASKGGVMVRSCFPTCPSKDVLKENDVILKIDGIPVASDGNVPFRRNGRERVSFASYVQTKFAEDKLQLDLWRDGKECKVEVPLAINKDLVPSHWDNQAPPYFIVGGLVFTALSVPYLEECGAWGEYVSDSLSYLMNKIHEPLEEIDDQVVVLINVLAHPKNTGYDGLTNLHLSHCNGTKVRSLQHLQKLIQQAKTDGTEEYLRLEFGSKSGSGGFLVVLETNIIEEINNEVCEEHAIQKPFYFPPSTTTTAPETAESSGD
jgi:S1-C subfamily serine protease